MQKIFFTILAVLITTFAQAQAGGDSCYEPLAPVTIRDLSRSKVVRAGEQHIPIIFTHGFGTALGTSLAQLITLKECGNYEVRSLHFPLYLNDDTVARFTARIYEYDTVTQLPGGVLFERELVVSQDMIKNRRYTLQLDPGEVNLIDQQKFFLGFQFMREEPSDDPHWRFAIYYDPRKRPTQCYQIIYPPNNRWEDFEPNAQDASPYNQLLMGAVLRKY